MVLGCISLLVTALMLMASFSLSNAIHEKIRIQSHADAQAYSLAVVEARAFNTTAYYNRAIAAALVAQMSLHSWMSIATHDVAMLSSGALAMLLAVPIEVAMGCYPYNISHCPCVIAALISAFKLFRAGQKWGRTLKGLENQFDKGVTGLKELVDNLHKSQVRSLKLARSELFIGYVLNQLKSKNASSSSYVMAVAALNNSEFTCALEGTDIDNCGNASGRSKSSLATRSTIMQNTANATRQLFNRMGVQSSLLSHKNFRGPWNPDEPKNQLSDGNWSHFFATRARVGDDTSSGSDKQAQAKNVGAGSLGIGALAIIGFKHCPPLPMVFNGEIYSGSPNRHSGLMMFNGHQGTHNKFEHVMKQEPCSDQSCFVNFNASSDKDKDFGQPTVYGGVSQSLRVFPDKSGGFAENAPWELNSNGEVSVKMSSDKDSKLKVVPRGSGVAVSKAKVYFHQMGNWKVAPNFFDPFWRAKLHFFKRDEFQKVIALSGDVHGALLVGAGAPVEGEEN
jgi:hypothetical protein